MSIVSTCYRKLSSTLISPNTYTQGAVNVVESGTTYSDVPILRTADSSLVKSVKVGSNVSYLATKLAPHLEYQGSARLYNKSWTEGGETCGGSSEESFSQDYLRYSFDFLQAYGLGENESITIPVADEVSTYDSAYIYPTSLSLLNCIYLNGSLYSKSLNTIYRKYSYKPYTPSNIVLTASSPKFTDLVFQDTEIALPGTNVYVSLYLTIQGSTIVNYTKPISNTSTSCAISPAISYTNMKYVDSIQPPGYNEKTSWYSSAGSFQPVTYLAGDY